MAKSRLTDDEIKLILSLDASGAQKSINDLTKENKELEKSNKDTRLRMRELEEQGKKNSKEWGNLNNSLKQNNDALEINRQKISQHEKTLGLENMTMGQLKKRAQELERQLNSTAKALQPEEYARLDKELKDTKDQMSTLKTNTKSAERTLFDFNAVKATGVGLLINYATKAAAVVTELFSLEKIVNSNNATGDAFAAVLGGLDNALNYVRVSLATMDFTNFLDNLAKAYTVGKEVTNILDELFERQNSFRITDTRVQAEIEELKTSLRDVNKSLEERKAIGDQIIKLTTQQAEQEKSIAHQKIEAATKQLESITGMTEAERKYFIENYEGNRDAILAANERIELEKKLKNARAQSYSSGSGMFGSTLSNAASMEKETASIRKQIDNIVKSTPGIEEAYRIVSKYNKGNDALVSAFVDSMVNLDQIDIKTTTGLRKVQTSVNSTIKEMADQSAKEAVESRKKQTEANKKAIEEKVKAVDQGIAYEKIALAKQYAGGLIDKSNYNKQLEDLELESLRRKLSIYGLEESKRKEIEQKIADYAIKMREQFSIKGIELEKAKEISIGSIRKKETENLKKISEQNLKIKQAEYAKEKELELKQRQEMVQLATAFSTEMGGIIGGALSGNDDMIKQSMVSIINMGLDYLKVQAQMAIAGATMQSLATPDSILTFGAAGLARAAILTGLIEAAFSAVKSVVGNLAGNLGSGNSSDSSSSQGTGVSIVPQRAEGKYDVIGSTDGRKYRNVPYIGTPQSGIIENPSLISEHGGELIISTPDMEMLKKDIRYPIMIQAINDARDRRVIQRAEGKYDQITQSTGSAPNAFVQDPETKKLNNRLITLLSSLEKNGVNIKYGHIEKSMDRANNIRTKTSRK